MNINLKTINNLINFNETYTKEAMNNFLKKYYSEVISTKDYIIAIGEIPIALVAHMDTVFDDPKVGYLQKDLIYDTKKQILYSPQGAGFDDKAGLYAIIQIVKKGYRPTILLTTKEERGGYGALALAEFKLLDKTPINYLIELDRRGKDDCVFYDCDNREFVKYIESFGFKEKKGTFSDISYLMPTWKICGVNLSVGYENEHTHSEILYVNDLHNTINKVISILQSKSFPSFEYIEKKYFSTLENNYLFGFKVKCEECGLMFSDENVIPYKDKNTTSFICLHCLANSNSKISWCERCGEAFKKEGESNLCHDCANGKNISQTSTK